ncbi:hypothetical protein TRFO_38992 [Tritrichomonas foetus]|uniref:Uncharacterized protein n=1 Tax=Tritrichomonas foetus TaxID=1144522 RepID=A0A1J4J6I0_9EUKA|nr:hypothetical protein TRFO_38992 [Tritrichomonas foetus]|eukprot:OHS94808.1 hypothetical protein TRFO_38992 [Tritrichomonas foetus]
MIDNSFGPWSSTPTPNRWEEFKIGQMEKWYDIIASSLNINPGNASSILSPTAVKIEMSRATAKSKATAAANKQQSKIPKPKSTSKKNLSQSPSVQSTQQISSIYDTSIDNSIVEPSTSLYPSIKYEPRDEFDAPRSFENFLATPSYGLQPWPQKFIPFDEVIGKAINPPKVPAGPDKSGRAKRKIPRRL